VAVANEARQHHLLFSGRLGDGRRAGVVFATLGSGIASPVVAELSQNPGAEDYSKSRQTANDLGVRVCLKRRGQLRLEIRDLGR
jgi:hypothetical protein